MNRIVVCQMPDFLADLCNDLPLRIADIVVPAPDIALDAPAKVLQFQLRAEPEFLLNRAGGLSIDIDFKPCQPGKQDFVEFSHLSSAVIED